VLQEIDRWANAQDDQRIFWLGGLAGTGKSTIARTVARKFHDQRRLGVSFFFSRGGGDIGTARKFATTTVFQLASRSPLLEKYICEAIRKNRDIENQSLADQWRELVILPLSRFQSEPDQPPYLLVVDALDECEGEDDIRAIIQLLAEVRLRSLSTLQILATSRPELPIRHGFATIPNDGRQIFMLHDISGRIVDQDISLFLKHSLIRIAGERRLDPGWPGDETIGRLVQRASGLFIWAATTCRFISQGQGRRFTSERLSAILASTSSSSAPEKHLDDIYLTVLWHSIPPYFTDDERNRHYSMMGSVLGSLVILFSQLSATSLALLLGIDNDDFFDVLDGLQAILDIPEDPKRVLRLHHPSLRDFLLDNRRCTDPNLHVDASQAHSSLTDHCIAVMSASLRQDICGIDDPGDYVTDVDRSRVEHCLPPEVKYACLYWVQHVQQNGIRFCHGAHVYRFLQQHLLRWLEALSWMQKISEGVLMVITLDSLASVSSILSPAFEEAETNCR
jgi:hypothetical protein